MKKFFKNPWTIGIGTAFFGFLLTVLYDLIKGKQILNTIGDIFVAIWHCLIGFLSFDLKVWWILIGIFVLFLILIIFIKISDLNDTLTPEWMKYTKDTIDGFCWEWRWEKTYSGLYDIDNLHPVCSNCKTPYVNADDYQGGAICPRCKHRPTYQMPNIDNIKVIIRDNVKRMDEREKAAKAELENNSSGKRSKKK